MILKLSGAIQGQCHHRSAGFLPQRPTPRLSKNRPVSLTTGDALSLQTHQNKSHFATKAQSSPAKTKDKELV
jgi:hypothetical protein